MASRRAADRGFVRRPMNLPNGPQRNQEIQTILDELVARINGKMTEGTGEHLSSCGNFKGVWWYNTTPTTPDTDFTITHNLGYVPTSFEIRWADKDARVYASPSYAPTSTTLTLRCTAATATLRIKVS